MIASTTATVVSACALVIIGIAVFSACRSTSQPRIEGLPLEFESLQSGADSAIREERLVVVHSQLEFDALWKEHKKLQIPAPPAPTVDFDRNLVVAMFLGNCPSAGYAVEIVDVRSVPANEAELPCLEVHAKSHEPDPDTATAQVMTAPFHVVRIPRLDGPTRLVLR